MSVRLFTTRCLRPVEVRRDTFITAEFADQGAVGRLPALISSAESRAAGRGASGGPAEAVGQPQPWECPRCGTINAWWVARCRCTPHPDDKHYPMPGRAANSQEQS